MKRKNRIYWIIAIVVVVLAAGGYGLKTVLAKRSSSSQALQTAKVTTGTITTSITGSGSVRSGQSAVISWQTSGTVGKVAVKIGQPVKKGDLLASLDPTTVSTNIITAQSDLINAQTTMNELLQPTALQIAQVEAAISTAQTNLDNLLNPTPLAIAQAETAVTDAQNAYDTLMNPTASAIAQAESNLTDTQTALETLQNPDPLAISNAQNKVLTDQTTLTNAQSAVDRLKYNRGTQDQIAAAQAAYVLAQSVVDRLQKAYEGTPGDPTVDPVKAQALSALESAKTKAAQALVNLNWLNSPWSATDITDRNNALAVATAQLATDQKTLNDLETPSPDTIALEQGKVDDAQQALDTLMHPTAVDIALAQAKITDAQKALDTLKNPTAVDIEVAKQQVVDAQNNLDTLKNPTADQITVAKSKVILAEATVAQVQLVAPFDGVVTDVNSQVGDSVANGTAAFRIDDLSKMYVDLQISEVDISNIKDQQPVILTFDAISGKSYNGIVSKIVMAGSVAQGVVNYPVTVQLTDADASVMSGMTAGVDIIIAQVANVLEVPNKAIHISGGQRTVTVLFQGQQISVPVTVGLVGTSFTEVTGSALKVGDVIVVSTSTSTTTTTNRTGFQGGPGGGGVFFGP
jgi:HlyD family secretion protein